MEESKKIPASKVQCPCGSVFYRSNQSRHHKTKKHIKHLESVKNVEEQYCKDNEEPLTN